MLLPFVLKGTGCPCCYMLAHAVAASGIARAFLLNAQKKIGFDIIK
jgi:hypothetical protein